MLLTEAAMEGCRNYIQTIVDHAEYLAGNVWTPVPITRRERTADGAVDLIFPVHTDSSLTITAVRLVDTHENVWAQKAVTVVLGAAQEAELFRFRFNLREEEAA